MEFEWDESKRATNLAKHGLDLLDGAALFDGRPVYTYPTERSGERRFVTIGPLRDRLVAIVWTERSAAIRLISLRRARDEEKSRYRALYG